MTRCSICRTILKPEDERTTCPRCGQDYHRSCWDEVGGCATYGCEEAPAPEKAPPPPVVRGGWGDEKVCPACRATISSGLLVCSKCRARFPWADPMSREDYGGWVEERQALSRSAKLLIFLFIFSLVGIAAPFVGLAAGIYSFSRRRVLAGQYGTYLALGYGTAALGGVYLLIFLLLFLGL